MNSESHVELRKIKIGEIGEVITGNTPSKKNDNYFGDAYPWIKPTDINIGYRYVEEPDEYYSELAYEKYKKALLPPYATCVVTIGTVGEKLCLTQDYSFTNQSINAIIPDEENFDKQFVYYLMKYNLPKVSKANPGTASGRHHVSKSNFCNIEVEVPSKEHQKKIASILSAFDDLIENNSRRIEILEEMARRIYREWFVHFRYPGHEDDELVDSGTDLGEIPEGWDIVEVQDVIDVNPRTSIDKEKERPYLPMANVSENSMLIDDSDLEYRDGNSGSKFKNYDTLFARITPSLENGKTGFVQFLKSDEQIALGSTEFIVLRSKKLNPYFVYCLARDGQFRESAIKSMVGASGRQRVRIGTVKEFKITFPPKKLLKKFSDITEPMFKKIGLLSQHNKKLKATRDLLLPKLISGKIDVEEVTV